MGDKKLVIVLGSMGRGGAERVISYVSEYFALKGWKVWIVLLLSNKVEYDLHKDVHVIDLSGTTKSRWKRLPYWLVNIRKTMKEIQPDSILSFAARINIIVQIACMGLKKKIVVSERNDPYSDGRSRWIDLLTNWLYPQADVVVFQTKRAASYFEKIKLKNAHVIANPVSVECKAGEIKYGKIVTVGRLTAQKNQRMLIDAFAEVKKEHPETELHIFGDGELRGDLEKQIEGYGLKDSIYLRGNLPDVHRQMADAAIFVLSSDYEGLSNALLEAMMMGIPCVSTDCAGADEYISNGKNGLLVHVGEKEELKVALNRLLTNPMEASMYGEEAAKSVVDLNKECIMEQWYSVIL